MKIAFFTDSYLNITGGIVTSIGAQKKALEALGHTVYLFSSGYPRSKSTRARLKKQNIFIVPSCKVLFRGIAPVARRPRKVEKWVLKHCPEIKDFDVFHSHYEAGCSIAGIHLGHALGIPVVQTMHGREDMGVTGLVPFGLRTFVGTALNCFHAMYLPHEIKVKKDNYLATTKAKAKMWTLMVNHANQADFVLTPSKHFRAKLKHYGVKHQIEIVSNGIEDDLIPEKVTPRKLKDGETLKIIWHSRLSPEKRSMKFMEALKGVDFPYEMYAFGNGSELLLAKNYAKINRLKVHFEGNSHRETIYERMKDSHIGVLVSYNYDNQPMTMLEDETAGLPILICDPDMLEVTAKDGVFLTSGPEPEDITKMLKHIYKNKGLIEEKSRAMIAERDNARQSSQIEKLINVYQKVVKK